MHEASWQAFSTEQRIALVYHELRHLAHKHTARGMPCYDENGDPVIEIQGHDVEEFFDVAARFGAWNMNLDALRATLNDKGGRDDLKQLAGKIKSECG